MSKNNNPKTLTTEKPVEAGEVFRNEIIVDIKDMAKVTFRDDHGNGFYLQPAFSRGDFRLYPRPSVTPAEAEPEAVTVPSEVEAVTVPSEDEAEPKAETVPAEEG